MKKLASILLATVCSVHASSHDTHFSDIPVLDGRSRSSSRAASPPGVPAAISRAPSFTFTTEASAPMGTVSFTPPRDRTISPPSVFSSTPPRERVAEAPLYPVSALARMFLNSDDERAPVLITEVSRIKMIPEIKHYREKFMNSVYVPTTNEERLVGGLSAKDWNYHIQGLRYINNHYLKVLEENFVHPFPYPMECVKKKLKQHTDRLTEILGAPPAASIIVPVTGYRMDETLYAVLHHALQNGLMLHIGIPTGTLPLTDNLMVKDLHPSSPWIRLAGKERTEFGFDSMFSVDHLAGLTVKKCLE